MNYFQYTQQAAETGNSWYLIIGLVLAFVGFLFWVIPLWNVWAAHKSGLADLAKAQNEQQCRVAEAKGRKDAAILNKEAAIIEAEAVAEQIKRIGEGLTEHDLYLKWQWIKMMEECGAAAIYVPTEAGIPILEAGARK